jgi:hypothetical protein
MWEGIIEKDHYYCKEERPLTEEEIQAIINIPYNEWKTKIENDHLFWKGIESDTGELIAGVIDLNTSLMYETWLVYIEPEKPVSH